jgi:biopolymer transport protein ExbD
MAFGGFERHGGPIQPMSEINVTPLVDVMLVLLIIFMITAPLLTYAVRIELPTETAAPIEPAPAAITLSVDADGGIFWDADPITDAELRSRLGEAAMGATPPEIHLRADRATRYERVAFVMAAAQQAGLTKIGFITEPAAGASPR